MEGKNKQYATELEYLTWFRHNIDLGPGEGDCIISLHEEFEKETGKKVPKGWSDEEE